MAKQNSKYTRAQIIERIASQVRNIPDIRLKLFDVSIDRKKLAKEIEKAISNYIDEEGKPYVQNAAKMADDIVNFRDVVIAGARKKAPTMVVEASHYDLDPKERPVAIVLDPEDPRAKERYDASIKDVPDQVEAALGGREFEDLPEEDREDLLSDDGGTYKGEPITLK